VIDARLPKGPTAVGAGNSLRNHELDYSPIEVKRLALGVSPPFQSTTNRVIFPALEAEDLVGAVALLDGLQLGEGVARLDSLN